MQEGPVLTLIYTTKSLIESIIVVSSPSWFLLSRSSFGVAYMWW